MAQSLIDVDFGVLRPMTEADLAQVLAWRNHPDIRANMYTQHEITMAEHRAWWDRMHEKFGFQREGLFKAHVMIGGTLDDVHRLALFAADWQAVRGEKLATLTALRKRAA